jgi:flagellar biosynthesis/type III secretory pathway chaperone
MKPAADLENILSEQKRIYDELFHMEEQKTSVIMDRSGSGLERISMEQERLLEELSGFEKKRATLAADIIRLRNLKVQSESVTLGDIIRSMDGAESGDLMRRGLELKETILRLQRLQSTNERLINDNMELFNLLLSGIKNTTSIRSGYDSGGRENRKTSGSVLFNKTA